MKLVYNIFTGLTLVFILMGCKQKQGQPKPQQQKELMNTLNLDEFNTTIDKKPVRAYTLENRDGMKAVFTNYGQRLISLWVPDKNGHLDDIVLGFSSLDGYQNGNEKYFGAVIGRYGNRIARGKFELNDTIYSLAVNNEPNHLHGGIKGFESVVWNAEQISEQEIVFHRTSPDGEEGYPGNLEVTVNYRLTDANALVISYSAVTDQKTIVNLTHHSFFNLKGEGKGTINDHLLTINADRYTPVDSTLIPTGQLADVSNTPFDFRKQKPMGRDIDADSEQLKFARGYDHNYVLNDLPTEATGLLLAATVIEPESGRVMEVFTDAPGMQFYSGNFLNGTDSGKSGRPYQKRGAFCLETQYFPDSPNQPNFPKTELLPGDVYTTSCIYKFSAQQ